MRNTDTMARILRKIIGARSGSTRGPPEIRRAKGWKEVLHYRGKAGRESALETKRENGAEAKEDGWRTGQAAEKRKKERKKERDTEGAEGIAEPIVSKCDTMDSRLC